MTITPVLLCGGSGTRLWPVSRKSYPKQFSSLVDDSTLFQASAGRFQAPGFAAPLVITASDFRFIVAEQLASINITPQAILLEPEGRNTAPAVLSAALHLQKHAPDSLMLVAASDHVITNPAAFQAAIEAATPAATAGQLVTFGITPDRAETGYGYLELSQEAADNVLQPLKAFVEKPGKADAEAMVQTGRHLWNAGIFLVSVKTILAAFTAHAPHLFGPVEAALEGARPDLDFIRLEAKAWSEVDDISIDYAVMERADNLSVVPCDCGWSDLGGWEAVLRHGPRDARGNAVSASAEAINCEDSLLRTQNTDQVMVGIGLKNVVAVAMGDAVLVADTSDSQNVKQAVQILKDRGAPQAEQFPKDHRPWGWFESLALGDRFQVKRIHVHPGGALSLQSHHHRAEHWIVVAGTAKVTIGDTEQLVSENQSVYIPLGAKHRMENPGKVPMVLIEVQTGAYLGEDDIIRYEDVYARD